MSGYSIAYEDEHLLVVDKGPGLVVHPARGHAQGTLSQLLAGSARGGDPERAGIVHRLDRDTSGLLVVARDEEVHRRLQRALSKRLIERALTGTSLLRLRLESGRTHQIRVHLRAIGHPVCGDREYGAAGALGLERQFLHACRLAFDHPLSGARVDVRSPLPDDLQRALLRAERLS